MIPDPCTPADLDLRIADDFASRPASLSTMLALGIALRTCRTAAPGSPQARRLLSFVRPKPSQCAELGIPFSALPMCQ